MKRLLFALLLAVLGSSVCRAETDNPTKTDLFTWSSGLIRSTNFAGATTNTTASDVMIVDRCVDGLSFFVYGTQGSSASVNTNSIEVTIASGYAMSSTGSNWVTNFDSKSSIVLTATPLGTNNWGTSEWFGAYGRRYYKVIKVVNISGGAVSNVVIGAALKKGSP